MNDADKSQMQVALSAYVTAADGDQATIRSAINEGLHRQNTGLTAVPSDVIDALCEKMHELADILL